jgi:hypothetical protein
LLPRRAEIARRFTSLAPVFQFVPTLERDQQLFFDLGVPLG